MDPSQTYPDTDLCKTSHQCRKFYNCLAPTPFACPYSIAFGYGYFCQHPNRAYFQQEDRKK